MLGRCHAELEASRRISLRQEVRQGTPEGGGAGLIQALPHPPRRHGRRHEEGQGMVEYALILILIALIVIVALTIFGQSLNNTYSNISSSLAST
ncbi:MAG: Flp family type IVb pilin [Candidatus Dormiibacterota bacterium]